MPRRDRPDQPGCSAAADFELANGRVDFGGGRQPRQTVPTYWDRPPSATVKVPLARIEPVAPDSCPVPPTIVCRSTIEPPPPAANDPAFFTISVPRHGPTRPVIVESDVNRETLVAGVSAVVTMPLAAPAKVASMSPR